MVSFSARDKFLTIDIRSGRGELPKSTFIKGEDAFSLLVVSLAVASVSRFVARTHAHRLKARKLARLSSDKCRRERGFARCVPVSPFSFHAFSYSLPPFLFPRVNSARYLVYACVMRAYTHITLACKRARFRRSCGRKKRLRMHARSRARTHARWAWRGRQARTHARTHACALRGSSFLRATDAPIRGRVSFVIRENVNQSLLAFALRSSAPNLPRGSSSLFVFQRAALFGPGRTLFVAFVADTRSRRDVELWIPF